MKTAFRLRRVVPWRAMLLFVMLALAWHLPLLWSQGSKNRVSRPEPRASNLNKDFHMVFQPIRADSWEDPTVYLFPGEQGFSKELRRLSGEPVMTPENLAPPAVIEPYYAENLGGFPAIQPAPVWLLTASAHGSGFRSTPKSPDSMEENMASSKSAWHVTGSIKERLVQPYPAFPVIQSPELLGATLLRVGVNPQGDPQFVLVEGGSGLEQADEAGVRFARDIRFTPSDDPSHHPIAWGHLKILWQAEEAAVR